MLKSLMLMVFIAVTACATPSQPGTTGGVASGISVQPGTAFDLGVGQEARIQGTPLTVRLMRVSEDSRCPVDVQCVWAGNAVIRLALAAGGGSPVETSLNVTIDPKSTVFSGHRVSLVGLKPVPRSGTTIPGGDYVVTLQVSPL